MSNVSLLLNAHNHLNDRHPSSEKLPRIVLGEQQKYLHPSAHSMSGRSPLPSPPLSNGYSYDARPPPLNMIPGSSSTSAASTPARSANTPSLPPPPAPPTQPSTIAPPPIQTASDMVDAEKVKKKHVCPTCSRPFTTSGHLARHLRVHTGERNHKCPFPGCETRCSRQDNLQQHYRIHLSPRSRRNSNAATRAAIAKAMEAQANGQNTPPASSPSTTLTLPPQAPRHHQSQPNLRPPPSPIENALGLDQPNAGGPPAPYHAPRSTLSVHHPSAVPGRYFSNGNTPGGYDSPRSSSAASSVHGGAPGQANGANPASAYPSPYSAGPMHHPLPPTGANSVPGSRSVSYDRVAGSSSFPSPHSPAPNAYPSPDDASHHPSTAPNGHSASHHTNGYSSSAHYPPQSAGYSSHPTYNIPPPGQHNSSQYYARPQNPPASSGYSSHGAQSPPPILPPIQQGRGWSAAAYPPPTHHHNGWATAQQNGHGSSSESGDETPNSAASHHGPASGWASSGPRPVSVSGGAHGGSY